MYDKLRFFKGFDYDLNLVKNASGVWEGSVYLDEVSTGLYETVNIFLLETVEYYYSGQTTSASQTALVKPVENSVGSKLLCRWIDGNDSSKHIVMYGAEMKNNQPVVKHYKEITLEPELQATAPYTTANNTRYYEKLDFKNLSKEALQLNITLKSDREGPHRRVLGVYDVVNGIETQVAEIVFYGEVVAEDERLRTLLQNFGATLDEGDFILFKEHDISEQSPDYKLLNRKRKELLLELHNIKPFVGTYKAILNAIDFFGYSNITLKEYWMSVDKSRPSFGKLFAIPVPNSSVRGEMLRKKLTVQIPSSTMKKTSRFSLVYRLNEPNGGVDQWDIPTVDEIFEYTPDEILIKLYGLKQKLQREYLPLNTKIVDITAEGDYFTQRNLNVWNVQNEIGFVSEGHDIKFKVAPEGRTLFIEDLGLVLQTTLDKNSADYQTYLGFTPADFAIATTSQLQELEDIYNEFYDYYIERDLRTFNQDIPVGCPVILDGSETFRDTWFDGAFTWDDAIDPNSQLLVTWDNWWKRWVYEVEWLVTGPNGFSFEVRGDIDNYLTMPIIVPYEGSYTVEMRVYDLFGHRSHYRERDLFQVELKDVELYGVYKWLDPARWNDKGLTWNKSGGYWDSAQDSSVTVDQAIASLYYTLDRANYLHDESQGIRFSMVRRYNDPLTETGFSETTGPYQFNECRFRWRDTEHLSWNATRVGSDLSASFKVYDIENGDEIAIDFKDPNTEVITTGSHVITSNTPSSPINTAQYEAEWEAIRDELNNSTDPIIQKFNWNAVFHDTNGDGYADTFLYMLAVGKEYSKNYDFESVTVTPNGGSVISVDGELHVVHYNPGFDDTKIFREYTEVERSTHVTIAADATNMPGIKNPKWGIVNRSNPEINDIYYDSMWLTYIFQDPGTYEITLEVEDTNGNHNVVKRNMINVK